MPLAVEVVEQMGALAYLHGPLGDGAAVTAEWRGSGGPSRASGWRCARPRDLRLFDEAGQRIR